MAKKIQGTLLPKQPLTIEHRIYRARKLIADIPFALISGQLEVQEALAKVSEELQQALQTLKLHKDTTRAF